MMKQWQFNKSGLPREVLHMAEVPIPTTCADDEVLIKVSYVGFNAAYVFKLMPHYSIVDPINAYKGNMSIPEIEFSGIVCDLKGKNAQHLITGSKVFGAQNPWFGNIGNGVLREYIIIKHDLLTYIPDNISLRDAASMVATGITIHKAMMERHKLKEGDRVFLSGGAGAVGVLATQLARKLVGPSGLVVTSCATAKVDAVQKLGAHEVIDYKKHSLPEYLTEKYGNEPFDVIYDIAGNDHALFSQSPNYLVTNGVFYAIGLELGDTFWGGMKRVGQLFSAMALPTLFGGIPRKHIFESTKMTKHRIEEVAELAKEGTIKPVIDSVFKFEDVLNAYDRILSRATIGKVLVEVCAE